MWLTYSDDFTMLRHLILVPVKIETEMSGKFIDWIILGLKIWTSAITLFTRIRSSFINYCLFIKTMLLRLISNKLVLKSFSFPSKTKLFIRPSTRLVNYKHFRNQIPNLLSISRLGCSFLVVYFIVNHDYHFALLTLPYCGVSDALDGSLARKWNCQTRFGQIIDPIGCI